MKYKTYYFDGQMDYFWGVMEFNGSSYVDVREGISAFKGGNSPASDTDFELAKKVNNIISSSSGNFIFIFKKGVHFPYNNSFDPAEAEWKPIYAGNPTFFFNPEDRESIVNSYDNGIKYNIDSFFKNLASDYGNLPIIPQ